MLNKERLENLSNDIWKGVIKLCGEYKATKLGVVSTLMGKTIIKMNVTEERNPDE